jgi:hypothetical protein
MERRVNKDQLVQLANLVMMDHLVVRVTLADQDQKAALENKV